MSNDLTKDEVVKMAQEADDTIRSKPFTAEMLSFLERFATLCRAPLVAENAALKQAHEINADTLNAMQVEIDDWKARALKAEPTSAVPVVEHLVAVLSCNRIMAADSDGNYTKEVTPRIITDAIAAGQKFIKESGK